MAVNCDIKPKEGNTMKHCTIKEARIYADFERGKLTATQAAKMIKKLAARKGKAEKGKWK